MYSWRGVDDRWIFAQQLPALLVDLAERRGIHRDQVLSGTGIFEQHLMDPGACISVSQLHRLMANVQKCVNGGNAGFLFGASLAREPASVTANALASSPSLQSLVRNMRRFSLLYSPMMWPRVYTDSEYCYLVWRPRISVCTDIQRFLMESLCAAVIAWSKDVSGQRVPWLFDFSGPPPEYFEQYRVHLGPDVRFGQHIDMMYLKRSDLHTTHQTLTTVGEVADNRAQRELQLLESTPGFYQVLYLYLTKRIDRPPVLTRAASDFSVSPATFKRQMRSHGIRYQSILDDSRRDVALYLYRVKGWGHLRVARYLGYSDMSNFRRSFKRWTGASPMEFLETINYQA